MPDGPVTFSTSDAKRINQSVLYTEKRSGSNVGPPTKTMTAPPNGRGLIKVRVAKDGDGPHGYGLGNKSHPCEATYTVTSWDGLTQYAMGATPLFQRPAHGKMIEAKMGLWDLSEEDPTQRFVMCDEVLDDGDC